MGMSHSSHLVLKRQLSMWGKDKNVNLRIRPKQLLLRGCKLRNTEFCIGFAVYMGHESKIMMNAKKPPTKISNVQKKMNTMLYSVRIFKFLTALGICLSVNSDLNLCNPLCVVDPEASFEPLVSRSHLWVRRT
jgi:magnesium-transporting ATPase (P-type)